jgi:hypothetical protein
MPCRDALSGLGGLAADAGATCRDDVKLGAMAAQRIDRHRSLADEKLARLIAASALTADRRS